MPKIKTFSNLFKIAFITAALSASFAHANTFKASGSCEVYFSPKGGATQATVGHINRAKSEIKVLAFYFTSKPIAQAIEYARSKGVNVRIVLDRSQPTAKGNRIKELQDSGAEVRIDSTHPIMHNKVIIIDNEIVITGSFNFSATAETRNAENLLICKNKEQAALYSENWNYLWGIARDPKDAPAPLKRTSSE
jgi:phosphatidylserine/phosphatidylglycerophosphate/cardiolipin synthase-like enzyme